MPKGTDEKFTFADDPSPKPKPKQRTSPLLEILLDWLLNRWPNPTVTAREIYRSGPGPLQGDKEAILNLTETLTRQGWLIPLKTWRYDKREWKIARGPILTTDVKQQNIPENTRPDYFYGMQPGAPRAKSRRPHGLGRLCDSAAPIPNFSYCGGGSVPRR